MAPRAAVAPRGPKARLVPGLSLHRGPDGVWRRFGPVDELLRITGPDAPVAAVADWLAAGAGEDPDADVLEAARALGLLAPDPREGADPVRSCDRASILGRGPVVDELRRLLAAQGWTVDESTSAADVVVVIDTSQRDADWSVLDARLVASATPWHRAFLEGRRWVVGPFWTAPGDASYRDYRVRRLAADAQPDELEARWRASDAALASAGRTADRVAGADPFAAVVAARIACDLAALRDGRRAPGQDTEALLDPVDGTVQLHPVLALPPAPGT